MGSSWPEGFDREGLGYTYYPPLGGDLNEKIRLRIDYLKRGLESHSGEITLESILPGMRGLYIQARFNLLSSTAQPNLAKAIKAALGGTPDEDLDWAKIVRTFFALVLAAEREGEPIRQLDANLPTPLRLAPLVQKLLPQGQNTMLYGPGGVGKGWLAVGIATAVALGQPFAGVYEAQEANVLYCDWEDSWEVFQQRATAVSTGMGQRLPSNIYHRECYGSLKEQTHRLARFAAENSIGLLVVDSVEMAAATSGDPSTYEDRARSLFEAINAMRGGLKRPLGVLLIDHVSEQGRQQTKGAAKPYGSVFKTNWARLAWEVRKHQENEDLSSHLGLFQWKSNHTAAQGAVGIRIEWDDPTDPQRVGFAADDISDHEELVGRLGLKDQIKAVLIHSAVALAPKDIAERSGIRVEAVRATLSRDQASRSPWFVKVGDAAYGLARKEDSGPTAVRLPYKDNADEGDLERGINPDEIPF